MFSDLAPSTFYSIFMHLPTHYLFDYFYWSAGRTQYVLHARGSSYAKEAAAVHRIPLIDVSQAVGLGSVAVVRGQEGDGRERRRICGRG